MEFIHEYLWYLNQCFTLKTFIEFIHEYLWYLNQCSWMNSIYEWIHLISPLNVVKCDF